MSDLPVFKKRKFYKKIWFWALFILILSIGGCSGGGYIYMQRIQSQNNSLEEETTAELTNLKKTVSLDGKIQSQKQVDLYFGASGQVIETQVQIGDAVKEDQLLAKIEADGYPTKSKEIKAPFAGIITNVNIYDDLLVTPQTNAITIESEETEIIATASENEVLDLKNGLAADITFDSLPNVKLTGMVISVAERKQAGSTAMAAASAVSSSSSSTEGYEIKLDYNKPADLFLKRDMSCNVEIIVAEKKNILAIPLAAIKWDNNEPYVNIKNNNNIAEKKSVTLGFEGDEYVEITKGLNAGDRIILFSSADVPDNGGIF